MGSDLLIEATPELLQGWTGPVLADDAPAIADNGEVLVTGKWWWWGNFTIRLDLSRAEVRDRVARCLAAVEGIEPGGCWDWTGGPNWALWCRAPKGQHAGSPAIDSYRRAYVPEVTKEMRRTMERHDIGRLYRAVPALADLDPSSDERLPDGSRRVDALALARCWEASRVVLLDLVDGRVVERAQ